MLEQVRYPSLGNTYLCTSPMHMMTGFELLILLVPLLVLVSIDTATKSPSL